MVGGIVVTASIMTTRESTLSLSSGQIPSAAIVSPDNTGEPTSLLDPAGAEASSSAHELQTNMIIAYRAAQSYQASPSNSKSSSSAIAAVQTAAHFALLFSHKLPSLGGVGGGGSGGPCKIGGNPLAALFNVATCATQRLKTLATHVLHGKIPESDFQDLEDALPQLDPKLPIPEVLPGAKPIPVKDPTPQDQQKEKDEDKEEEEAKSSDLNHSSNHDEAASTTSQAAFTTPAFTVTSKLSSQTSSFTSASLTSTSFTSSSSGSKTQYLVFASLKADANSIGSRIASAVPDPAANWYSPPDDNAGGAAIWIIPQDSDAESTAGLNETQASAIQQLPGVSLVVSNDIVTQDVEPLASAPFTGSPAYKTPFSAIEETVACNSVSPASSAALTPRRSRLERRDGIPIEVQARANPPRTDGGDVPYELRAIVQKEGLRPMPILQDLDYVYGPSAGAGTWVYVVDGGIDDQHPVSGKQCFSA